MELIFSIACPMLCHIKALWDELLNGELFNALRQAHKSPVGGAFCQFVPVPKRPRAGQNNYTSELNSIRDCKLRIDLQFQLSKSRLSFLRRHYHNVSS